MSQVTISFPVGGEEFAEKSLYLARSIRENTECQIVTGIREKEREEINNQILEELEDLTDIYTVERTVEKYPISIKTATMEKASEVTKDSTTLVHTDSDTLILKKISEEIGELEGESFMAKPVDFGNQYYAKRESFSEWKEICNSLNKEFRGISYKSMIDNKKVPAYFNAGTVVTNSKKFPKRWNELTRKVWNETGSRYSDQIALGLLEQEFKRVEMGKNFSWNLPGELNITELPTVLRYEDYSHVLRAPPKVKQEVESFIHLNSIYDSRIERKIAKLESYKFYLSLHYRKLRKLPLW